MQRLRGLLAVRGQISRTASLALGAAAIVTILIVWSALTYSGRVSSYYLPTPTAYIQAAVRLLTPPAGKSFLEAPLIAATGVSLERTLKALALTTLIGVPLGILMGSFPAVDSFFGPPVSAVKAVPATAFIGLVIMVFGIEEKAKVAFLILGAVFFMILMVRNAVLNVREAYVRTATDIGVNGVQMIGQVLLPGALPEIWEALILCNGIMWTYIVIAEYVNAQSGLGALIHDAERAGSSDMGQMYVAIVTIALVAVGTDALFRWAQRQWFPWKDR